MVKVGYLAKARSMAESKWSSFVWIIRSYVNKLTLLNWSEFTREPRRLMEMMILFIFHNSVMNSKVPWLNLINLDPLIIMRDQFVLRRPLCRIHSFKCWFHYPSGSHLDQRMVAFGSPNKPTSVGFI